MPSPQNVVTKLNGKKLVIEIDLTTDFGSSGTGRTLRVASTRGWHAMQTKHGNIAINLNCQKRKE